MLSQLDAGQLCQVLQLLQSWQLDIPAPQQAAMTDRTLLPAEHQAISQFITRLAALTGETPIELWENQHRMMRLKSGAPIPACHPLKRRSLGAALGSESAGVTAGQNRGQELNTDRQGITEPQLVMDVKRDNW